MRARAIASVLGFHLALGLPVAGAAQAPAPSAAEIDFGNDAGVFANDGECDDLRFAGAGMSGEGLAGHVLRDATDCRAAYEAGNLTLRPAEEMHALGFFTGLYDGLDFGDNTGTYARDGECDDPRFTGQGRSRITAASHEYQDAADCQAAYAAGRVWLIGHGLDPRTARFDGIDFGDDRGEFPADGVCDDPRFEGEGMGGTAMLESDIGHDARDCLTGYLNGEVTLKATPEAPAE